MLAQRTSGNEPVIAKACLPIDHQNREVFIEPVILKPIIHDDQTGIDGFCQTSTRHAVTRFDNVGGARQKQRLVTHFFWGLVAGRDHKGPRLTAAIAACEENGCLRFFLQHARQFNGHRGFANAARCYIANANDRHASTF